jgi:hypothetical protein
MTQQEKARQLRPLIEKAAASLSDADASMSVELFPQLKQDGSLVEAGTRINWNGKVKKNGAALWDREENDPDHAPTLWEELAYRDGIRVIPEVITTTTLFSEGELGWWGDVLYRSKVNGNVYTPAQYAANWEVVE